MKHNKYMKKVFSLVLVFIVSAIIGFFLFGMFNHQSQPTPPNNDSIWMDTIRMDTIRMDTVSEDSTNGNDVDSADNVNIKNESMGKNPKDQINVEKNKMSAAEFQNLIVGGDNSILGGKNPKVAKTIQFSVDGLREGDRRPQDVVGIREKVGNGIWTSFRVSTVGYDSQGKIDSAVIVPNYPD